MSHELTDEELKLLEDLICTLDEDNEVFKLSSEIIDLNKQNREEEKSKKKKIGQEVK